MDWRLVALFSFKTEDGTSGAPKAHERKGYLYYSPLNFTCATQKDPKKTNRNYKAVFLRSFALPTIRRNAMGLVVFFYEGSHLYP